MHRIVIAFLAIAFSFASHANAECFWIDHIDTDPTYFCTSAQHETIYTGEPDWCDFVYADMVFVRRELVGGVVVITGWWVRLNNSSNPPPPDFDQYPEYAVVENCSIVPLPF